MKCLVKYCENEAIDGFNSPPYCRFHQNQTLADTVQPSQLDRIEAHQKESFIALNLRLDRMIGLLEESVKKRPSLAEQQANIHGGQVDLRG